MRTTLDERTVSRIKSELRAAQERSSAVYPGESGARQPVHTVYGGAHLFRAETARKLSEVALRLMDRHVPTFRDLGRVMRVPGHEQMDGSAAFTANWLERLDRDEPGARESAPDVWLAFEVHRRVRRKLAREAVEDFRIDFEDGFGHRPDEEEDRAAVAAAAEVARGLESDLLPPFIGIRVKPLTRHLTSRSLRTLDLFLTALLDETDGRLPSGFVVTLPKVVDAEQVSALARALDALEQAKGLTPGSLRLELMIETTQSIMDPSGRSHLLDLVVAAEGRCAGAHFGVYDYTAAYGLTASQQSMRHPACDVARHSMKVALTGTGVWLSDGATNVIPVEPHAPKTEGAELSDAERAENRSAVEHALGLHYDDVRHSLASGFYQGWDLHPAHLITRYAALYAFFLEDLASVTARLRHFVDAAARATLAGSVFDDAATGQGLLNFFLRGLACGAISEAEALATGLSLEELQTRSFAAILDGRQGRS